MAATKKPSGLAPKKPSSCGFQKGRAKTGGRKKGTPSKKNAFKQTMEKLEQEHNGKGATACRKKYGTTPLEFMLGVMNDEDMPTAFRYQAAKDSAPYQHAKLASVVLQGDPTKPLQQVNMNKEEFETIAKQVAKDI